jgi:hypothetical protein
MGAWHVSWAWGLPLIVPNLVVCVLRRGLINEKIVTRMSHRVNPLHPIWSYRFRQST